MKKFLNYFALAAMIGWAAVFIYHISTLPCNDIEHYIGSFFLTGAFFILHVMTEERPLKTRKQKDYNHQVQMSGMTTLLLMAVVCIVMFLSSCRAGYGCHGRESWNGMIKRINRP
jgi:heme A synthase